MEDHNQIRPALRFSAGEHLAEELAARSWTQRQFAAILDRPVQTINAIIRGKKIITPETAMELGAALGTSAELWLNLDANYRLWLAQNADSRRRIKAIAGRAAKAESTQSTPSPGK